MPQTIERQVAGQMWHCAMLEKLSATCEALQGTQFYFLQPFLQLVSQCIWLFHGILH